MAENSLLARGLAPVVWLLAVLTAAGAAVPGSGAEVQIDFTREIRPILSENCFTCHGPDEKKLKAGLRLDLKTGAFQELKSGNRAIVPGDPAGSELIARITTEDEDDKMPPPKSGKELTAGQIDLLRRWVSQGASYKDHWAYTAPARPQLPEVQLKNWPRQNLDHFILSRIEQEGLKPSPEASRETLIRRASLDLIGLPPGPSDVAEFVRDNRPDAYERLVDRLLASPRYGERWASPWLDQARYADSNGYEADFRRSIWPYRDWVIEAFNRDMPFDQFTIEQMAGDLLPNATREQRIATGFHRNTMVNTEGGTDEEEFRIAAIVDRVNTTFGVWMGTTMGCAQCHSHKYDPFTQREYYQLSAFFNQTNDKGRSNEPELELPTPAQEAARAEFRAKLEPLEKILGTQTTELDQAQAVWEADLEACRGRIESSWVTLQPDSLEASGGVQLTKLEDHSARASGALPDTSIYEIVATTGVPGITALRLETLADAQLPNESSGRSEEGDFVLTEFTVQTPAQARPVQEGPSADSKSGAFALAYADFSMEKYDVKDAIDGKLTTGWSIAAHEPANRVDHQAVFVLKEPIDGQESTRLVIQLKQESERRQHLVGRFRLSISTAPVEAHRAWGQLPPAVRKVLAIDPDERHPGHENELARYYRSIDPTLEDVRQQLAELRKQEPKDIAKTLVLEASKENRPTHVLIRGNHLTQGEEVSPGTPAVLHSWPPGQPLNRLGLAHWLVDPANPLVGRVTMNRVWAQFFGRGLVETSEEFGAQGDLPSHPELLDWLATEFVQRQWSFKVMHRLIVTSATYRQSSDVTPELAERDPFNRLLARGPRFRLDAEMLRDNALAIGGLLHEKIGGPSVFPHQPDGVWNSPYNGDRWVISKEGDQFRRGLYTFWRRTAPYASFMAFDAPSREVMCERRPRSNTPIQALVTLNDPAFVAAANGLARRILEFNGKTARDRMVFGFECCLARQPSAPELAALLRLYDETKERFAQDSAAAQALTSIGGRGSVDPEKLAECAAWTVISNVLLNLDEALTKG